jgi:hypothetical protein
MWLSANKTVRRTWSGYSQSHAASSRELKALRKVVDETRKSDTFLAQEAVCFEKVIAYFESDLEPAKRRANAWAQGHATDLVSPTRPWPAEDCGTPWGRLESTSAAANLSKEHPDFAAVLFADPVQMKRISQEKWLAAAEHALAGNASTFSLLPVNDMLGPDGLVTRLEERGYRVEISAE